MPWIDLIMLSGLLYSVYTDFKERKIKNYITFPLMALGLIYSCATGGIGGLKASLSALLLLGVLSGLLYAVNGFGMGDVKLLMAIGAIKGLSFGLETLIFSFFAAVIALMFLYPKRFIEAIRKVSILVCHFFATKSLLTLTPKQSAIPIAYSVYIFIGLVLAYFSGGDWVWALFTS